MKFLIVNTDYPPFIDWLYSENPWLSGRSYNQQLQQRYATLFGVADFYSHALQKLGHEATDVYFNNSTLQKKWAQEHGTTPRRDTALGSIRGRAAGTLPRALKPLVKPVLRHLRPDRSLYDIFAAQIRHYKPDVVLNQAMGDIDPMWWTEMKPYIPFLIGQHASGPLTWDNHHKTNDLVISSFPPTVDFFRKGGVPCELNLLGFDPRVLAHLKPGPPTYEVSFVGSLQKMHSTRMTFLENLCERFGQMRIWAPRNEVPANSAIQKGYVGTVWGREMYQVLRDSEITINHHGDFLPWANNLRLFEATGVGTFLITDWRSNLSTLFEPGSEVAAYKDEKEAKEMIAHFLERHDERDRMAKRAHQRTLREHTYDQRMAEVVELVRKRI